MSLFFFFVSLVVSPVYADPYPVSAGPNSFVFGVEVLVGETVAWLIGAEFLWRLLKARVEHGRASRSDAYRIMLVAMVTSFSIGLLIWKAFGLL
jgi:hypothetical protein